MSSGKYRIPDHGWKVRLDHKFPETRNQYFVPDYKIIFQLFTLIIRYFLYEIWCYIRGRKPVMDYIKVINPEQIYGVPLGGIGGGTIGRGFSGQFCRFQLKPGIYEYDTIDSDQFIITVRSTVKNKTIYQNVLSACGPPKNGSLNTWKWNFPASQATYTALYPRSWTEYFIPKCNIRVICQQISPIIPQNYKDSSLPGGVFNWIIENNSSESFYVTITMSFKGYKGASAADPFELNEDYLKVRGVKILNSVNSNKCIFAFGAKENEDVHITSTSFNPHGTGAIVWDQLLDKGHFEEKLRRPVKFFGEIACGVAAQTLVESNSTKNLEFALVWHMPFICFRNRQNLHERYYTKHFGNNDDDAMKMCHYALSHYKMWETAITEWQSPILNDSSLPDWYKSAIFNELYFISDGGTLWLQLTPKKSDSLPSTDVRRKFGLFSYLEGHEYRMYNTYDVHFYASFALTDLWPKLQLSIQYEFQETIPRKDCSRRWFLFDGHFGRRKESDCVPHDIGDPEEEPFLKLNSYPVHDVTDWKDLNLKFILQSYRDYQYTKDEDYLRDMWPSIKLLMEKSLLWDTDGDGMIENNGSPDQTYDTWTMSGVSSYCGSLWLGALCVTVKMASIVKDENTEEKYREILRRATDVFSKKLWNGSYYDFDSESKNRKSIMADQLCGLWYLYISGIEENILPKENIHQALRTIFDYNVKRFKNGKSGAVNGMFFDGQVDKSSVQSQEVWTGVTYGLASHFILHGMEEEGFATAEGIYNTVYNEIGLAFCTPEAIYESKYFRSVSYMRPLCIWSMQVALRKLRTT